VEAGVTKGTPFGATCLGISTLLVSSALAFTVVKYLGALYLIFLGVRRLLEKPVVIHGLAPRSDGLARVFGQGVLVNVLNPKTALFFFAFLPQFVDPSRGDVAVQVLLLGMIWTALATCSDGLYALLAGLASRWLTGNPTFLGYQRYFAGGVFVALGVGTGLSGSGAE
jgi:threonine/homoserine/homoserine lactone efflux protein